MMFLNWHGLMNPKKTVRSTREVSCLLHIHVLCLIQYFPPFVGRFEYFKMLNDAKVANSDIPSERYQEVNP